MHITVVPVNFDANEADALKRAVASFNDTQDKFVIEVAGRSSVEQLQEGLLGWLQLKRWLEENYRSGRVIAVTSASFTDNWFAHTEGRLTAITTADWRRLFSPPGPHCYLLMEFALACYFYASDISEAEAQPHAEPKGCLLDLCGDKREMRWKLRIGYLCSMHRAHFRRHGGNSEDFEAINRILAEVRRVTLDLASSAVSTEDGGVEEGEKLTEPSNENQQTLTPADLEKKSISWWLQQLTPGQGGKLFVFLVGFLVLSFNFGAWFAGLNLPYLRDLPWFPTHRPEFIDTVGASNTGRGPPLDRCLPGSIGLNLPIKEGVKNAICFEDRPTGKLRVQPETNITGAKNALLWYVFSEDSSQPLASCVCYE